MKIKLDTLDKISEVASLFFITAGILIVAFSLPELPDTVPVHFDLRGEPNRYGSKYELWVVAGVSLLIWMLFSLLSSRPHLFNYPSQKNDQEAQYKLGAKMMRSLKAWILFFFVILNLIIVYSARSGKADGAIWLIAFLLMIVAAHLVYFFTKWKKIK